MAYPNAVYQDPRPRDGAGSLQKQITISSVFVVLIFMRFSLVHFDIMLTESCKSDVEFEVHISKQCAVVYILVQRARGPQIVYVHQKFLGPVTVFCGTPPFE